MKKIIVLVIVLIIIGGGYYFVAPLFVDDVVSEEFPEFEFPSEEEIAQMTPEEKLEIEMQALEFAAAQPDVVMAEPMLAAPTEPVRLSEGQFQDQDNFHRGSGNATIYELPDGKRFLRFEDFEVTNGPDLHVLLVKNSDPDNRSDVQEGYLDLGELKGNLGDQNYEVPEGTDLSEYGSVVIYCQPFHVIFSVATLN